ncbi:hypothetical protein LIER_24737 [Lithospermum erythrorhizon]|uniref:Uncharacterized protein n=1 Tax=Lithospermum erythrorhizon TaxID=34254 RepID=A0AAV3R697_LITER
MARRLFTCFGRGTSSSNNNHIKSSITSDNATADLTVEEQRRAGPIMVELFSSQGCAISPQAELLLSKIGRGDYNLEIPVILLGYHVDIWDYMGWKDPFGSSQWTVRQKAYVEALQLDNLSTPQIVVQGRAQCVGNDEVDLEETLLSLIKSAPRFPAPTFQVTFQRPSPNSLVVSLNGALRTKIDNNGVDVMVALYECGLVTNCDKGENKDRVLKNDYVVRKLEKLCSVKDIAPKKTVSGTVEFSLWDGFNSSKCGVSIFLQNSSHQIFGSQKFQLPTNL